MRLRRYKRKQKGLAGILAAMLVFHAAGVMPAMADMEELPADDYCCIVEIPEKEDRDGYEGKEMQVMAGTEEKMEEPGGEEEPEGENGSVKEPGEEEGNVTEPEEEENATEPGEEEGTREEPGEKKEGEDGSGKELGEKEETEDGSREETEGKGEETGEDGSGKETDELVERKTEDGSREEMGEAEAEDGDDVEWEKTEELLPATMSNALPIQEKVAGFSSGTGDLWEEWNSRMDFPGDGTKRAPYQIDSLSRLMGLSEAVAAGEDFDGEYFELTQDINLGDLEINKENWNPIGWYQNKGELGGEVRHPFRGHFDGGGNTISGLRIVNPSLPLTNIGLFGVIDGGEVRDLTVEAEDLVGEENIGVLAGAVFGDAVIYNVAVSGYVNAKGDAGGIAGKVTGTDNRATIENCRAEGIVLNSEDRESYVGGIAGNVQNAWLVDNVVITQNGDANRIRGKGYVGGIAGRISQTDVFNSYVNGTVGGNGSRAAGGIVGEYRSGNVILARMAGRISATNNGTASREGTFVGTRQSRDRFTYGTEKDSNFSYLFTNDGAKAKNVVGSTIDGDNTFTQDAHIGYWTDNERKYRIVAGRRETDSGERYFYEELEDAVRYFVTQKLEKEFTSAGYAEGISFRPDHFAPGYMGAPVRGYLVSVPRIDTKNDNGTYDTDVAELTAIPATGNSYYRTIDKEHGAAVVPGAVVTVATAPKNKGENRYQMVVDPHYGGGVKPPTYMDESGRNVEMDYKNGGSYSFIMPECDTELNVEYIKVTTRLTLDPQETSIHIVQTRSGDRKHPNLVTEVTNQEGALIARYIDEKPDTSVQVQPVTIHGEHNGSGWVANRTMKWSVDDTNLLTNLSETGYTQRDAVIMPNLSSNFVQGIINREIQAQADNQYREKINNTIYMSHAVVTAATDPKTSADNRGVYANCRVKVSFQIIDNTTLRVEGMNLNRNFAEFTVTRRLTGNRLNPQETITVSEPVVLSATLNPTRPFFKNVWWNADEGGKILSLAPSGDHTQDCRVSVNYDPAGDKNPAWIQNIISEDREKKKSSPYSRQNGSGEYSERVTAASEDQTNGHVFSECLVTVRFRTEDETMIHPEAITLSEKALTYQLSRDYFWGAGSSVKSQEGFGVRDTLEAFVLPKLESREEYQPYDQAVIWNSSDPDAVKVAGGVITVCDDAAWIQEALKSYPYQAQKDVVITAKTRDMGHTAQCTVHLDFQANTAYVNGGGGSGGGGGGSSGGGSSGGGGSSTSGPGSSTAASATVITGGEVPKGSQPVQGLPDYVVSGTWLEDGAGRWTFSDGIRTYANEWAAVVNPYADKALGQQAFDWFRFGQNGFMVSGWYYDGDGNTYYLNPFPDGTQGRMATGWQWITDVDGKVYCYYFNEKSDGTRGALLNSRMTPDGYLTDEKGRWVVDGRAKTR